MPSGVYAGVIFLIPSIPVKNRARANNAAPRCHAVIVLDSKMPHNLFGQLLLEKLGSGCQDQAFCLDNLFAAGLQLCQNHLACCARIEHEF